MSLSFIYSFIYLFIYLFIFGVTVFLLSSLGAGPSFMLVSLLVLELRKFSFIRD